MSKFLLLVAALSVISCRRDRNLEVEIAMKSYDRYLLHQQADSIAGIFLPNGKLGGEGQSDIIGADSIRKFLLAFQTVKVLENRSNSQSIQLSGDSANQKGTYKQVITFIEKGDTLELGGQFEATWVEVNKAWKLRRMYTSHYTNKRINSK